MVEGGHRLIALLVVIAFLLAGCAGWSRTDKILLGASILAAGADAYTTCRALDNPGNWEVNPLLGKHPSKEQVVIYLGFTEMVTILVAHFAPTLRPWLLGGKALVNTGCAINNSTLEW